MEKKVYECPEMETFFFVTKENLAAGSIPPDKENISGLGPVWNPGISDGPGEM